MGITLYDRRGRPTGATCQTTEQAVALMRTSSRHEYAEDEHGLVVVARRRPPMERMLERAQRAAPDVLPGQLDLYGGDEMPHPLPRLVPVRSST